MKKPMDVLRELREDRDLKQDTVAKLIGTTQQQYSKYETGRCELPLHAFITLIKFYGISADHILGATEFKQSLDSMSTRITPDYSYDMLISDVLSLSKSGRNAVIEYIELQKMKEKTPKK